MKIAILSYGHFASIMPLAKAIAKQHNVSLYLVVQGNSFTESVGTLKMEGLENGLQDQETTRRLLDENINNYLGTNLQIFVVKYPDLRVKNPQNYMISFRLARHLNKEKYDVVHFNGIKFFQLVIFLFLRHKKAIWTIHDPFLHSGEEKKVIVIQYKILSMMRINMILHNQYYFDTFITTYKCNPSKVHFLPYAPLEIFHIYKKTNIQPEPATALFFGRVSKYKGVDYLIEAARIAEKSIPGLKVIIAGTGEYSIDLESLKNDPLFEIHHRFIPNEELVSYIQRSSVVVCPYTDATQSGVIMTAYALSKPVIASAVGGLPEVVKDHITGLLIPPKDAPAIAKALIEIISKPVQLEQYSKNIEEQYFFGEFSWGSISKKLISIYNKIA